MLARVKEDSRNSPARKRVRGWTAARTLALSTAGVLLFAVSHASGQAGSGKEFRASVLDLSAQSQRITVPLNRSVTVETTVEVARADVIARQVADVQVVSPTRVLFTGQAYGTTSVVLTGVDGKQHVFEVVVELDVARLNETMKALDPLGDIKATSVRGHIVLTGTASSSVKAKRIAEVAQLYVPLAAEGQAATIVQNHVDVAGESQVLLRCVVAEVSRSAVRELGINGFIAGDNHPTAFAVNQIGGINPTNIGAAADALVTERIPFVTGIDGIPLNERTTLSLGFPRVQMQLFIRAMADNSLLSVLAEPNLVAISGETATFLAGGEFPIPVPQGNDRISVEFREFGVRLNFTPVVEGEQRIRLRIAPEVSDLDFTTAIQIRGLSVPGLTSRAAETTVEVGSGQTIAIAGLLNERVRGVTSAIPGLGEVPILGALFRSVNYQRSLSELVILVTPEIVAPMEPHQMVRMPGDDIQEPGDFQLYGLGLLEAEARNDGPPSSGSATAGRAKGASVILATQPEKLSIHGPWGHAGLVGMR